MFDASQKITKEKYEYEMKKKTTKYNKITARDKNTKTKKK